MFRELSKRKTFTMKISNIKTQNYMPNHQILAYIFRFSILCKISCQHLQVCPSNRIPMDRLMQLERRQSVNFSCKYLTFDRQSLAIAHQDFECLKRILRYLQRTRPSREHKAQQSMGENG